MGVIFKRHNIIHKLYTYYGPLLMSPWYTVGCTTNRYPFVFPLTLADMMKRKSECALYTPCLSTMPKVFDVVSSRNPPKGVNKHQFICIVVKNVMYCITMQGFKQKRYHNVNTIVTHHIQWLYNHNIAQLVHVTYTYSGTSDNGHSEKRTTSVQRTDSMARIEFSIALILN